MEYELFQEEPEDEDAPKEWRWRLWSRNGRNIANSGQGYKNRRDCLHRIELVKSSRNTPIIYEDDEGNEYEIYRSRNGKWYKEQII